MVESSQRDILQLIENYPIPPSQEIRLEKSIDRAWINENIYYPLLTSTSSVQIIDPFIGRELHDIAEIDIDKWLTESQWIFMLKEIFDIFKKHAIFQNKSYTIYTALRVNEEQKALDTAHKVRKQFMNDPNIDVKFVFFFYEKSFNPPDEFPHDRYVFTDHIGINIGVGLDTLNTDDKKVRRETQFTIVGRKTISSVLTQLRCLPSMKKRRILRKKTI